MIRIATAALLATILCGCASMIMESYVGKDVREAVLDYGVPANAVDLGDGTRAFQWTMNSSYTMPVTATTTGYATSTGPSAWVNTNTVISGGQTVNSSCTYTVLAKWNDPKKSWIISDYRKPRLMCE